MSAAGFGCARTACVFLEMSIKCWGFAYVMIEQQCSDGVQSVCGRFTLVLDYSEQAIFAFLFLSLCTFISVFVGHMAA